MSEVLRAVGIFCSYAVLAVFAQSAVFTRGLGVSRLVQLVGDDRTNSWWFALLLCVTQLLVAPLAFYAGQLIAPLANRAQLRPVVYVACVAVVCIFEHLVLRAVKGPRSGQLLRILPVAAINSCVLGTVLVERTQSFTLGQSLGFGLGSGLGRVGLGQIRAGVRQQRAELLTRAGVAVRLGIGVGGYCAEVGGKNGTISHGSVPPNSCH